MADEDDSENVVGDKVAASFDPGVPGRAVVKMGPSRLQTFQAAYVGGWTSDAPPPPEITIDELRFGPPVRWQMPKRPSAPLDTRGPNDLKRLVETVRNAFSATGLSTPRRPWLKELADTYDLGRTPQSRTDETLIFGVLDEPEHQRQAPAAFHPDRDGNMAIYGTGGSGKTATLRSLAIAAGLSTRGGPCHVYALDFGARALQILEALPHVGAVVAGEDHERVTRLLRWLREVIDERAVRYAAAKTASITDYRKASGRGDEPRLLLLIDNMAAFRSAYETGDRLRWLEVVNGIAADGRQVGVHVVVTADRTSSIPSALSSVIQKRLVLRLASEQEYAMADVPPDAFGTQAPPGRGFLDGAEVQVAVLGGSPSMQLQARAIEHLAAEMRRTIDRPEPHRIGWLTDRVGLSELPVTVDGLPVLGIADETLAPIGFWDDGPLLVTGPPRSGRTTTVAALALSFRRARPGARVVYIGHKRSPLWSLPVWESRAAGVDDAEALARTLTDEIVSERVRRGDLLVAIDGVADYADGLAEMALVSLFKAAIAHEIAVVCDVESSVVNGYSQLMQTLRSPRHGIALQPEQHDGEQVFKTPFPRISRAEMPPGRGFYVRQGIAQRVQVALDDIGW